MSSIRGVSPRFALLLAAGVFLVIGLVWALVLGDRAARSLDLEYEAYRSSTAVLEEWRNSGGLDPARGIIGFGLYDASGALLLGKGTVPSSLVLAGLAAAGIEVAPGRNSMKIRRSLGGAMMGMMGMGGGAGRRRGGPGGGFGGSLAVGGIPAAALYLEYPFPGASLAGLGPFLAAGTVSLALLLLYALLLGYARRNAELRERELRTRELAELGEAARTLAHEIKNPLAIIRVQTATLRRAAGGGQAQALEDLREGVLRGAQVIEDELARLAGLSDRIRDFLKGGSGEARELPLADYLADFAARYAAESPPLVLLPVPAELRVYVDPERLSLALDNLVRNAYEAGQASAAAGGPPPELRVEQRGKRLEIALLDRGPGVAPEERERIFELFHSTKGRGSGIGLALSRRIAEAAGGSLEYRPREGGGAVFVLSLPASGQAG